MSINMTMQELAEASGGRWLSPVKNDLLFSAVTVLTNSQANALCVAYDKSPKWKKAGVKPQREEDFLTAGHKGAAAFIVGKDFEYQIPYPVLQVEDTWQALSDIATYNRDHTSAKRILVTGSVGKTNYKLMAHHALSADTNVHAVLSSANLNVPIWCSLASIGANDDLAIIEVSVATPKRGWQRSEIIKPNILVITNISESHTHYHGSIENLIRAKAESVTGLQDNGVVLLSTDHPHFLALKNEVQKIKPVPVLTWGRGDQCDAQLISSTYDTLNSRWEVNARLMGSHITYWIGTHHSFAPISSLSILLTAAVTGVDIQKTADKLGSFIPGETTGRLYSVSQDMDQAPFTLFDYSQRGSIEGFRAALSDLYRMSPQDRRILMALGECRDLSPEDKNRVHREVASLIQEKRTSKIFTVGDGMQILRSAITEPEILGGHSESPEGIMRDFLDSIRPCDIVFIQGHHRVWMSKIVDRIHKDWQSTPVVSVTSSQSKDSTEATSLPATNPEGAKLSTFLASGDLILSRDFPGRLLEEGPRWVFGSMAEETRKADSFLVNLECVISQRGDFAQKIREKRPFHFRSPQFVVDIFQEAGVSILCTANNHSMDFGADALADQIELFELMNLAYVGSGNTKEAARQWALHRCGDVDVAVIAFDTTAPWAAAEPQKGGNFFLPCTSDSMRQLQPIIDEAKKSAHVVIVTVHWGSNWSEKPSKKIIDFAHSMIDGGVDAILGHSAHVLHGVEQYRNRPIVYDMGTLISDRVTQTPIRDSALFELTMDTRGIHQLTIHPIYLSKCRARSARNSRSRINERLRSLSADLGTTLVEENGKLTLNFDTYPARQEETKKDLSVSAQITDKEGIQYLQRGALKRFEPAPLLAEGRVLKLGGGLEIGGYRHPQTVACGYAFVFEIRFRCLEEQAARWRASLSFVQSNNLKKQVRYPVADGTWHSKFAGRAKWIADRTLVRTPVELAEGTYKLYWNLWTRNDEEELVYWHERHPGGNEIKFGIGAGEISISSAHKNGVAGVDSDSNLTFQDAYLQ